MDSNMCTFNGSNTCEHLLVVTHVHIFPKAEFFVERMWRNVTLRNVTSVLL